MSDANSELPAINYRAVSEKYAARNSELQLQVFSLENLADSLRAERDESRREYRTLLSAQEPGESA